jgi:signal peptidase I
MEPAVVPGDKLLYWTTGPDVRRGDVVMYRLGAPDNLLHIGRLIGLPGDTVACCTAAGLITVDGRALRERYVFPGEAPSEIRFSVSLRAGQAWVMGDHRTISLDSRIRGPVPLASIAGRVSVIIDGDEHATTVRTPTAFVAAGLAPADRREPAPYGWLAAFLIAIAALIGEAVTGVVLVIRSRGRRRRLARPEVSSVQLPPPGYR